MHKGIFKVRSERAFLPSQYRSLYTNVTKIPGRSELKTRKGIFRAFRNSGFVQKVTRMRKLLLMRTMLYVLSYQCRFSTIAMIMKQLFKVAFDLKGITRMIIQEIEFLYIRSCNKESRTTLACLYRTLGRFYMLQLISVDSRHFTQPESLRMWACSNTSSY